MSSDLPERRVLPDNVGRLPLIVTQREHEPAESILCRLALANGFLGISRLLKATLNLPDAFKANHIARDRSVTLAARLGALDQGSVEAATPDRRAAGGVTLYGHSFRAIRTVANIRICPACLEDDTNDLDGRELLRPYRRNWWCIGNIGACPTHGIRLVDRCPKCSWPLKSSDAVFSCRCDPRVDFRQMSLETIPEADLIHDRWLLGRLGIGERQEHGFLDGLSIDVGSRLCLVIGALMESGFQFPKRGMLSKGYSVRERSDGWRVLSNWPHSFDEFLDRLIEHNSDERKVAATRTARYGRLIGQLRKMNEPELDIVCDRVRNHVERHQLVSHRTRIFGHGLALGESIALFYAAALAGCGEGKFLEIYEALKLPKMPNAASGTATVATKHIETVRGFLENSVTAVKVSRLLECNYKTVDKMIELGVLRIKLPGKVAVSTMFEREDVDRLMKLVSVPLPELDELGKDLFTVRQAVAVVWSGEATILKGLMCGDIRAVGRLPEKKGFKGMIFRRSDVLKVIPKLTGRHLANHAARNLGWKRGTIFYLKKMGLLNDEGRYYVSIAELKAFHARHITMEEMLQWKGARSKPKLRKMLEAQGVEPVIEGRRHVTGLWPRRPAERALRSRLG